MDGRPKVVTVSTVEHTATTTFDLGKTPLPALSTRGGAQGSSSKERSRPIKEQRRRSRSLPTLSMSQMAYAVSGYRWPARLSAPHVEQDESDHASILREVRDKLSEQMAVSSLFFSACDADESGQIELEAVRGRRRRAVLPGPE